MNGSRYFISFLFFIFIVLNINGQSKKILIDIEMDSDLKKDSIRLSYWPVWSVEATQSEKDYKAKVNADNSLRYIFYTDSTLAIYFEDLIRLGLLGDCVYIAEPGDSIKIKISNKAPFFSGNGYLKFELICKGDSLIKNHKKIFQNTTFRNYLERSKYMDQTEREITMIVNAYKNIIPPSILRHIKAELMSQVELDRVLSFFYMIGKEKTNYTNNDLAAIYDSSISPVYTREFANEQSNPSLQLKNYLFTLNLLDYYRKHQFLNYTGEHDQEEWKKMIGCYFHARDNYKDRVREEIMAEIITFWIIRKIGFTAEVEKVLNNYYSVSNHIGFKNYVKSYETKSRKLTTGGNAYDFSVTDQFGKSLRLSDLKGKIVLMDFWFTGCKGCAELTPALKKVEDTFKDNPNVVFLSISVDSQKDKWLNSISAQKYTVGGGRNAYTSGKGTRHELLKKYNISAYPALFLIDGNGQFIINPVPDPRKDDGSYLCNVIKKQFNLSKDGPHVLYRNNRLVYKTLNVSEKAVLKMDSLEFDRGIKPIISVNTDDPGKTFNVNLKQTLQCEPSIYSVPSKILALSDIEGNFEEFRKLLQSNGVIDTSFNWSFGDGHLVLVGDFFDRGNQVTECLWLIYSLEEKAKAHGGYVHFILGNHEIMNLSGNTKYIHKKYLNNEALLKENYVNLYSEKSELGRWLRTKNIMEKIGDVLFVHGGISDEVNRLTQSISEINDIVRPYYSKDDSVRVKARNTPLTVLYNTKFSPFWCRDYYENPEDPKKASIAQIDSSLNKFKVQTIVTGHTIVSDTISIHYQGKVINTDTHHAAGISEALLIEEDCYYRVNMVGRKRLLYKKSENVAINFME